MGIVRDEFKKSKEATDKDDLEAIDSTIAYGKIQVCMTRQFKTDSSNGRSFEQAYK